MVVRQPKCSEDSYLVVRDDFWLSWTTGQPLSQTLLSGIIGRNEAINVELKALFVLMALLSPFLGHLLGAQ